MPDCSTHTPTAYLASLAGFYRERGETAETMTARAVEFELFADRAERRGDSSACYRRLAQEDRAMAALLEPSVPARIVREALAVFDAYTASDVRASACLAGTVARLREALVQEDR